MFKIPKIHENPARLLGFGDSLLGLNRGVMECDISVAVP